MELSRTLTRGVKRTLLPAAKAVLGTVTHVETDARVAALTFDGGPHATYTPRVMEILERHGAKVTFLMIGEAAERLEDVVGEAARLEAPDLFLTQVGTHWRFATLPDLFSLGRPVKLNWQIS